LHCSQFFHGKGIGFLPQEVSELLDGLGGGGLEGEREGGREGGREGIQVVLLLSASSHISVGRGKEEREGGRARTILEARETSA